MRYEHRETDYYDKEIRIDEQSPVYDEFIPTASVGWSHRGLNLSLTYRMMKGNPSYSMLTNAISYRTQYSYTTGNPRLEPSQTNTLSLNASYKWLFASIQYFRPKNTIANITMPYNEETHPGVLLFGAANLAAYNGFAFNLSAFPKFGRWQPQFYVSAMLSAADGRNLGIDVYRKQPVFNFGWDNSFNLPHGWFLNLQANMNTAARMGYAVIRIEGRVNARVSKSFLKEDALTLSLTANDILRTGCHDIFLETSVPEDIPRRGAGSCRSLRRGIQLGAPAQEYHGHFLPRDICRRNGTLFFRSAPDHELLRTVLPYMHIPLQEAVPAKDAVHRKTQEQDHIHGAYHADIHRRVHIHPSHPGKPHHELRHHTGAVPVVQSVLLYRSGICLVYSPSFLYNAPAAAS